ncbi:hypothetical protein [Pseudodesulfovibrio sp.]|uniref:hypothetical protein n=1 Tax=unclassified Pseudodesulfovibrio TaxID=2661612 RepID=UPI003B005F84
MNRKLQMIILRECEAASHYPLEWKRLITVYNEFYPAQKIHDTDYAPRGCGLIDCEAILNGKFEKLPSPPKELMATIKYLEERGFIKTDSPYYGQVIPDVIITADGSDYLNRPCWIVRILKEVIEKSLVNGIGFILGIISTWILIKILPVLQ